MPGELSHARGWRALSKRTLAHFHTESTRTFEENRCALSMRITAHFRAESAVQGTLVHASGLFGGNGRFEAVNSEPLADAFHGRLANLKGPSDLKVLATHVLRNVG